VTDLAKIKISLVMGLEEEFKTRKCKASVSWNEGSIETTNSSLMVYYHHDRDYIQITATDMNVIAITFGTTPGSRTVFRVGERLFEYADPNSIDQIIEHAMSILK
jgi:IS30 family transposase